MKDSNIISTCEYIIQPDRNAYYIFATKHYSFARITKPMRTVLDLCTVPTSYGLLKNEMRSLFGEIDTESLDNGLEKLYQRGIISIDGVSMLRDLPEPVEPERVGPATIELMLTDRCNLSCIYCVNEHCCLGETLSSELSLVEWKAIIDQIVSIGTVQITVSGGEPLLHPDAIGICGYAKDKGLQVGLFTNAQLIGEHNIDELLSVVDNLKISLDSHIEEENDLHRGKNTYAKIMKVLDMLSKRGRQCSINAVITSKNIGSAVESKRVLSEHPAISDFNQCMQVSVELGEEYDLTLEQIDHYLSEKEKYNLDLMERDVKKFRKTIPVQVTYRSGCGVANTEIAIGPNGDVYPCSVLYAKELSCGNAIDDGLEGVYRNSTKLKEIHKINHTRVENCMDRNCAYYFFCSGGCLGTSYFNTGEMKPWGSPQQCHFYQRECFTRMKLDFISEGLLKT